MQRHNILILILVTLIVTAFPVLYQARAYERDVSRRVYQVRLLTIQPTATAGPALQPVFKSKPWEMKKGEGLDVTDFVARSEVEGVVVSESIAVTAPSPLSVEVLTKTEAPAESVQEKSDVNFEKTLVYEIRRLTNHIRKRNDLNLFEDSGPLTRIALGHSADMLAGDYFAHTTPDGCTLTCRFETAVYTASTWGENIATIKGDYLPSAPEVAQSFFDMWMQSNEHRKNILSEEYTHQGVGVVRKGEFVYVTVNFAKPYEY